jgi:hypothetical protein
MKKPERSPAVRLGQRCQACVAPPQDRQSFSDHLARSSLGLDHAGPRAAVSEPGRVLQAEPGPGQLQSPRVVVRLRAAVDVDLGPPHAGHGHGHPQRSRQLRQRGHSASQVRSASSADTRSSTARASSCGMLSVWCRTGPPGAVSGRPAAAERPGGGTSAASGRRAGPTAPSSLPRSGHPRGAVPMTVTRRCSGSSRTTKVHPARCGRPAS